MAEEVSRNGKLAIEKSQLAVRKRQNLKKRRGGGAFNGNAQKDKRLESKRESQLSVKLFCLRAY